MRDEPGVPCDRDARPSLSEVLALRQDRMATARQVIEKLTADRLDSHTEPATALCWSHAQRCGPNPTRRARLAKDPERGTSNAMTPEV
jgi:hypothetical protein